MGTSVTYTCGASLARTDSLLDLITANKWRKKPSYGISRITWSYWSCRIAAGLEISQKAMAILEENEDIKILHSAKLSAVFNITETVLILNQLKRNDFAWILNCSIDQFYFVPFNVISLLLYHLHVKGQLLLMGVITNSSLFSESTCPNFYLK